MRGSWPVLSNTVAFIFFNFTVGPSLGGRVLSFPFRFVDFYTGPEHLASLHPRPRHLTDVLKFTNLGGPQKWSSGLAGCLKLAGSARVDPRRAPAEGLGRQGSIATNGGFGLSGSVH